jgi:Rod binding domain-containing protein
MDVMPVMSPPSGQLAEPELESLSARVKHGDPRAIPALARQFESVFMAQMVKEMRQTLEPDTLFGNDPGDVYGGMFDLFMGKHLAQAGGIGLAKVLERHMHATGHHRPATSTSTPTGSPWEMKPQTLPQPV